jgi:hypothetical protein
LGFSLAGLFSVLLYWAVAVLIALEALTVFFCRFFAGFVTGAAFAAVFFTADFFAATGAVFAAFVNACLFRNAVTMFALPAALNLGFAFTGSDVAGDDGDSVVPLIAAQRFFCPRAIRRRAAAETVRVGGAASGVAAGSVRPPGSMARSSAIWLSILAFWDPKPSIAAMRISVVSLFVGIRISMPPFPGETLAVPLFS